MPLVHKIITANFLFIDVDKYMDLLSHVWIENYEKAT